VVAVVGATAELHVSRQADVAGMRDHSRERRRDRVGRFTVVSVNAGLRRLMTLRADPVKIDWAVAALFTVTTQQAIWVADDGAAHRLGAAALALAITVPVAVLNRPGFLGGS
jgi:hypothetical protein